MAERDRYSKQISKSAEPAETVSAIPIWVSLIVVIGAFILATGATLALVRPVMLVSPNDEINSAVHVYAGYLASRNGALAVMLLVLLALGAKRALSNLMVVVALIQVFDACQDCIEGRWMIVPGVLLIGMVFLIGSRRLTGYPFWKAEAWR
jgi:hypothetical protein